MKSQFERSEIPDDLLQYFEPVLPPQASLADYDKLETTPCLVCDPFCGSGTVAVVSKKLQRNYIGIEISEAYVKMAEHRLAELGGLI